MTPTPDMLALARRIAAKAFRDRKMPSPSHEASDVEAGRYDEHSAVQSALAAIIATQEACAKVAQQEAKAYTDGRSIAKDKEAKLVCGMCALTTNLIAATIRAGKHYGGEGL